MNQTATEVAMTATPPITPPTIAPILLFDLELPFCRMPELGVEVITMVLLESLRDGVLRTSNISAKFLTHVSARCANVPPRAGLRRACQLQGCHVHGRESYDRAHLLTPVPGTLVETLYVSENTPELRLKLAWL